MNDFSFVLLLGDMVMLGVFVLMGKLAHGLPLFNQETLITAVPILLFWLGVGILTGAFRESAVASISVLVKKTVQTTLIAIPLGLILRAYFLDRRVEVPFLLVSLGFTFVFVGIWRFILFLLRLKKGRSSF